MSESTILLLVIGGLIVLVIAFLWITYNSLVTLKARVDEAWSGIDVQLKRRASLIPNLVETVKGYASHEKKVLQQVTEARSALMSAGTPGEKAAADNMLSGTLKSLFAVSEAYPDLKANENFVSLQRDLSDTEDKIAYARQFYNSNVMNYNVKIKVFPNVLIAGTFGFNESEFYEADEESRQEIDVTFSEDNSSETAAESK